MQYSYSFTIIIYVKQHSFTNIRIFVLFENLMSDEVTSTECILHCTLRVVINMISQIMQKSHILGGFSHLTRRGFTGVETDWAATLIWYSLMVFLLCKSRFIHKTCFIIGGYKDGGLLYGLEDCSSFCNVVSLVFISNDTSVTTAVTWRKESIKWQK